MLDITHPKQVRGTSIEPLVSVIVANYNYAHFLQDAIDSVLEQTYANIELIVVDDGSTDSSRNVIESYGDRLITIFQSNTGMGGSRSAGLAKATGEIICFLDADDYFHKDKIAKVVAAFQAHPNWIQLSHLWTVVDKEGTSIGSGASDILSRGDVHQLLLKWGKYASGIGSALAYRRSALDHAMPLRGDFGMDSYLNATLPFYGEVGCVNEPLMYYRMHGSNVRAHSDNLPRLIKQREMTAMFINDAAAKTGRADRFDLRRDPDYQVYLAIQQGSIPLEKALQIIWLSIRESIGIRRSPRDTLIRLLSRGICALFPDQGPLILRYGLRNYVRSKVWVKPETETSNQ